MDNQIGALREVLVLKTKQLNNKIKQSQFKIASDSLSLEAANTNMQPILAGENVKIEQECKLWPAEKIQMKIGKSEE